MCLIVLETKGLPFLSTGFHSLVWNIVSYCSQRNQAAIWKKNLFTDFWLAWLFHGGSSQAHFPWEKSQTKPFFYVDVVWSTALIMLLPGQQLSSFFLAPYLSQDAEGIHLSRTRWELFTMQKSCLILPKSHFWKQTLEPPPRRRSSAPWPLWPNGCQNLLQQLQLWILTVSGCLTLCSDRTSWEEPLNSSTSLLTHSWEISVTAMTSTCLFEKKRQKPAALGGLYPPGAFLLVQVSRKAITTWSLTCEFTSTAFKACPAAGSTTGYSCVGIRDSFIEWGVTAYFLIWINYVHLFFSPQFLSGLTGRPESQNGCNQIKLSKATVSTDTGAYSAHFAQNNPIAVSPFHTKLVLTASDNQKFSKSTLTLRISLLNYFTSI